MGTAHPGPDRATQRLSPTTPGYPVGTIDIAIPKLRSGNSYFPEWLLERRKRAESALITVVADCYLAGVSTLRMDKLVKTLGINNLSKSQVSCMAADLDEHVDEFRHRPLDEADPFTFVAADALTMKVREGGRVINAVVLVATGVNGDGHREVLGLRVATSETGAAWNEFFADLVARGLGGVKLVTSDAHQGLKEAIAANLPGAGWQRCRTHYSANLMSVCPKTMWPAVKAMLHSVYDQPDAPSVQAQFDRLIDYTAEHLPEVADHLAGAREDILAFTGFDKDVWTQIWSPPSDSTGRSVAAPIRSASSRSGPPSSVSSALSWPSKPTNGQKAAATSDSKCLPAADSPPSPTPPQRRRPTTTRWRSAPDLNQTTIERKTATPLHGA